MPWRRYFSNRPDTAPQVLYELCWAYGPHFLAPSLGYFDGNRWYTYQGLRVKVTWWHPLPRPPRLPDEIMKR